MCIGRLVKRTGECVEPSVLVVDDSENMRADTKRILEQSTLRLRVIEAVDGAQALPIALSGDVDMVVSDIVMPKLDGIQLLRGIRQQMTWDDLPVILVTSMTEEDTRNQSFEAGANDYLSRPFSPEELLGRIRVQLRLRQLQDDLRRANERHRRLGSHDELTGLANRRHLLDLCRRELSRSRRHKLAMSIAMLDIDDFARLNREVGALVGDAIITEMAEVVTRNLRTADVLARVGPQKFAVMLPHTDAVQGQAAGERIRAAVEGHAFPNQRVGDMTVCVGVATYPAGPLESVDELVNAAEACLDRAKGCGGNRVDAWSD